MKRAIIPREVLLVAAVFLVSSVGAGAATVTSAADSGAGSLRAVLASAVDGDTVDFDPALSGQTITLLSEISIGASVTISGPGSGSLTVQGNGANRLFEIAAGKTVSISGLALNNGVAAGGTGADGQGGAILNHGTLSISACTFSGNQAVGGTGVTGATGGAGAGGAIFNDAGATLNVSGSTFSGNNAVGGTGGGDSGGFAGTGGTGKGGAISTEATSTATVTGSTFSGNHAGGGTGGANGAIDSGFGGEGDGGAIAADGSLDLTLSTLSTNTGTGGTGGAAGGGGSAGSGGDGLGGGLFISRSAVVTVGTTRFDQNQAAGGNGGAGGGFPGGGHGGAIGIFSQGTLTLADSTLSGNQSIGECGTGGGIHHFGSNMTLTNDTLEGNSAQCSGGAIDVVLGATLLNCTISGNSALQDGGGMSVTVEGGPVTLTNTIVAANSAPTGPDGNVFIGTVTSGGHNVIGIGFTGTFTAGPGDQIGSSGSPLDPGLDALGNNGGPTPTMALKLTSPALDHGDDTKCPPKDQTTITTRPQGAFSDVGAFELPATTGPNGNAFTLTVDVVGDGSVTSAPAGGIECPTACAAVYLAGTNLVLTETPGSGSSFRGWGGGCSGFLPTAPVVMNADVTCTATFGPAAPIPTLGAGMLAALAGLLGMAGWSLARRL